MRKIEHYVNIFPHDAHTSTGRFSRSRDLDTGSGTGCRQRYAVTLAGARVSPDGGQRRQVEERDRGGRGNP